MTLVVVVWIILHSLAYWQMVFSSILGLYNVGNTLLYYLHLIWKELWCSGTFFLRGAGIIIKTLVLLILLRVKSKLRTSQPCDCCTETEVKRGTIMEMRSVKMLHLSTGLCWLLGAFIWVLSWIFHSRSFSWKDGLSWFIFSSQFSLFKTTSLLCMSHLNTFSNSCFWMTSQLLKDQWRCQPDAFLDKQLGDKKRWMQFSAFSAFLNLFGHHSLRHASTLQLIGSSMNGQVQISFTVDYKSVCTPQSGLASCSASHL